MASITCSMNGVRHTHGSSADVRACQAAQRHTATPAPYPARPHDRHPSRVNGPRVIHTEAAVTEAQLWKVKKEGGDPVYAAKLTRLGASIYIQQLIEKKENRTVVEPTPRSTPPKTIVPLPMLDMVKDGRYAWRPDANTKWTFVRISRPRNGRMAGCTKIQTQHGDTLTDRMSVYPSGHVWLPVPHMIESQLIGIIVDQKQAALDYGREIGKCCRCGKKLTDERSRWYGIGPECEKVSPDQIAYVEEQHGTFTGPR